MLKMKKKWMAPAAIVGAVITTLAGCVDMGSSSTATNDKNWVEDELVLIGNSDPSVKVNIIPGVSSVTIDGFKLERVQDGTNTMPTDFIKTSRPCPPFCLRAMQFSKDAPGVETVGELEVINYAKQHGDDSDSILLVDARTPEWNKRGTIPTSYNAPFSELDEAKGATDASIAKHMETFGVIKVDGKFNFKYAKTLVVFCNGAWCGQSHMSINALLKLGYPQEKLKYYRGGMQSWVTFGLGTVKGS